MMRVLQALLLFIFLGKETALALRLQGVRPNEQRGAFLPLVVGRELWASGVDSRHRPESARPDSQVWSWTDSTVQAFKSWLDDVQNPRACEQKEAAQKVAFVKRLPWGLTSRVRDYENVLLMNMVNGKMTLYHDPGPDRNANQCFYSPPAGLQEVNASSSAGAPIDVSSASGLVSESTWRVKEPSVDPFMNCIFQPLSSCQGRILSHQTHVGSQDHQVYVWKKFRAMVDPWWNRLKDAGLQQQDTKGVVLDHQEIRRGAERKTAADDGGAVRLGVLRALLASVTFQPSALVNQQIEELEHSLARPEGPMLIVHVRRTEKYRDEGGVRPVVTHEQDLVAMRALIRLAESSSRRNYTSFFLISDDPSVFAGARMEFLRSAFAAKPVALYNPFVQGTYSADPGWQANGHKSLQHHTPNDLKMMGDIFYAARHGVHLVGRGRSGISQFIAQKLGARFMVDPNVLSLFEDDEVLLTSVIGAAAATSHLAFLDHIPLEDDLPEDIEAVP